MRSIGSQGKDSSRIARPLLILFFLLSEILRGMGAAQNEEPGKFLRGTLPLAVAGR
jgi:hypothetical protein